MLAVAGGLAFPSAQNTAAQAQTSHAGYTYTQMVCQELGQQPRQYGVRDPRPGSDWRNDGGWAIVLIRSVFFYAGWEFYDATRVGGTNSRAGAVTQMNADHDEARTGGDLTTGQVLVDRYGAAGWVSEFGNKVTIDRNNDGVRDGRDTFQGGGPLGGSPVLWYFERRNFRAVTVNYGAQYIRWANMLWCR